MISALLVVSSLVSPVHDTWADNSPVPAWVKSTCCGPKDVHRLDMTQVWPVVGGWRVQGLDHIVPDARTYPSLDGKVYAFYDEMFGREAVVNCLFIQLGY